jgi:two-component system response regulator VicR
MAGQAGVLVAVEDGWLRSAVVDVMTEAGYGDVAEAAEGFDALCLATLKRPTIVVLDLPTPPLDAVSILRRVRRACPVACIAVLIGPDGPDALTALARGADLCLHRGDLKHLAATLRAVGAGQALAAAASG